MKGARGLSLLELVVAMAIFALVAIMGLQLLTGTLRMRDRLESTATATAELSFALALLRADLEAMVPLLFFPPGGPGARSALVSGTDQVAFSIGGQLDLPPVQGLGLHRVDWRIQGPDDMLTRQIWPVLYPANPTAQSPPMQVMGGVRALSLRSYWPDVGWVQGVVNTPPVQVSGPAQDGDRGPIASETYSDQLPTAVELTLETVAHGQIVLLESLQ